MSILAKNMRLIREELGCSQLMMSKVLSIGFRSYVRYEAGKGFSLDSPIAKPLVTPYPKGETERRYCQDAAIRAVFEKIASGNNRALLTQATGAGKTFIAVNLLKRISDAGLLRKALFLCDRDELRRQALSAFQNEFGSDAAAASAGNPELNARVVVATYQTLGVDKDDSDSSFLHLTGEAGSLQLRHLHCTGCVRSFWLRSDSSGGWQKC